MHQRSVGLAVAISLIAVSGSAFAQPGDAERRPRVDTKPTSPPVHDHTVMDEPEPVLHRTPPPRRDYPAWRRDYNPDGLELVAFSAFGGGQLTVADGFELAEAGDDAAPDALRGSGFRLDGVGWGAGGGGRFLYQSTSGVRMGTAVSYHHVAGHTLIHDPLPAGIQAQLSHVGMLGMEVTLGKAFDAHDVLPYVDLVGRLNVVFASVDTLVEPYGTAGATEFLPLSFSLAPRVGLFIPLNDSVFIDVAAHVALFGLERGGAHVAFGFFDML